MVGDKAAFGAEFRQYRADMDTKLGRVQASLNDEERRASEGKKERDWPFLSKKPLKAPLRHRSVDSEKVGSLQYRLDDADAKERQAQKAGESLPSQLNTGWAPADSYRWGLPSITEHVKTNVADGFGGFLFEILQEARKLIKKQQDTIQLTVKKGLEAVVAFLRSLESELSRLGPSRHHQK